MIRVIVFNIIKGKFKNQVAIVLKSQGAAGGVSYLPIWVGPLETYMIGLKFYNKQVPRPFTHDLFKSFIIAAGAAFIKVIIYGLADNTFYSKIVFKQNGEYFELDSRPSDAIALALRMDKPIFVTKKIISEFGLKNESDILAVESKPNSERKERGDKRIGEEELRRMSAFVDFVENLDIDDIGGKNK